MQENFAEPREAEIARDLARRIQVGESDAESELVRRYSRGLTYLLRRLTGDPALADDLHQETFRVLLERLRGPGLEEPERLAGFLRRTARNLFIAEARKKARRQTDDDLDEVAGAADLSPTPLDSVLVDEEAGLVRRMVGELATDRDRQILYRFYLAEEAKERICHDLGLDKPHFNRVLHRARGRLRDLLRNLESPERSSA